MKILNKLCVFTKRILLHRLYILMLAVIIILTAVYRLLPEKNRSTDIKVALYFQEDNAYTRQLLQEIESENSVYSFYTAESEKGLIDDVKSGKAECGYVIPVGFFEDYIHGHSEENPLLQYIIPSSTLHYSINETFFSNILEVTASKILVEGVDIPEYNEELEELLYEYIHSDSVFTLTTPLTGEFTFDDMVYKLDIPVYEISILLILFSALLGLLMFYRDKEKGMYDALPMTELLQNKVISIATAIIPLGIAGCFSVILLNGLSLKLVKLALTAIMIFIVVLISSALIRKSTVLVKVLPLLTFISTIILFVSTLM
ncbi:MAG: hypothetical protein ACI4D8_02055 [Wujia sp.]